MSGRLVACSLLILAALQAPALAQGSSSQSASPNNQANNQSSQPLPREIKQKLQKQGFSDINVVPGSFIVSAKDSNKDPVMMVIGPHSLTMFTEISTQGQTTGSASGGSGSSTSGASNAQGGQNNK
ncbi:hypothetical protein [Bradyrhizobium sp. CCBAU 53415]|uniref:hypothetical protein n=1 Tax=Bradyrhizobium sp. CCBAU 53415 TaxID=1325119 RepID=UPI00230681B8|nr:hypothetical protein [Bradyrhizobium sp. CCBAU 53415]